MSLKCNNIGITYRTDLKNSLQLADELTTWLHKKKKKVFSHREHLLDNTSPITKKNDLDLMIVLGGDGTYLGAVRFLDGKSTPILGVNLGRLGFLTEVNTKDLYDVLEKVFRGRIKPVVRSMLEIKVLKNKKMVHKSLALNDVVVERGSNTHLIDTSIFRNNSLVSQMRGDGLIIASPTGSTAYNLSAGGPILHPEVPAFVVTPICPHSLTARPIVFSDQHFIRISLNKKQIAMVMVDGQPGIEFDNKCEVQVKKSDKVHLMIPSQKLDYFELLNAKLEFGQRA